MSILEGVESVLGLFEQGRHEIVFNDITDRTRPGQGLRVGACSPKW
ncbi:hypothetical protein ACU4GD_42960 [Cupriavidus basilensis]